MNLNVVEMHRLVENYHCQENRYFSLKRGMVHIYNKVIISVTESLILHLL